MLKLKMSSIEENINYSITNFIKQISLKYDITENELHDAWCNLFTTDIISSKQQSKDWRKKQIWYKGGKKNECELFQKKNLEQFLNKKIHKTNFRLNIRNFELREITSPMNRENGFDWTENFDYTVDLNDVRLFFNLKFICDDGGAQTRSLREVYHFIEKQLEYLLINKDSKLIFINILEGNTSYKHRDKYIYLTNLDKYKELKDKVFVGDFLEFTYIYGKYNYSINN